jgi:hypothetical protein
MKTALRLAFYGLGVAAVFGVAAATGAALGPIDVGAPASHTASGHTGGAGPGAELSGLSVASDDVRLVADVVNITADQPSSFTFRIETSDGSPVTEYDILHERRLHLIVLSRNLIDYLHLHPTMDANGAWQVDVPPLHPGSYRVYADFQPTGADRITLGTDIQVPGLVPSVALPVVSATAETDGYHVSISGGPVVGASTIEFDVSRNGEAVAMDPYLGAAGHLVVIRTGDLGYLHVHPTDSTDDTVRFGAEFPTPGVYRLFFDFAHDDAVHTASFTIEVPPSRSPGSTPGDTTTDHEGM